MTPESHGGAQDGAKGGEWYSHMVLHVRCVLESVGELVGHMVFVHA